MWFQNWINKNFDGKHIYIRCRKAAKFIGCSQSTMIRLYYGYEPRNYGLYKKLALSKQTTQ